MSDVSAAYAELLAHLRETALLASCSHVLGWDEQTNLPPQGAELRSNQMALLAGLAHERATAPRLGELFEELSRSPDAFAPESVEAANLREARRAYERALRLPRRLVEELSRVTTLSQQAWTDARRARDFGRFQPWLEQVVHLKREEAQAIGSSTGVPYDALLDEFEPGMTSAEVTAVFSRLRDALVVLAREIADSGRQADRAIMHRFYPIPDQRRFGRAAAEAIGFDFTAGRLDEAAHPFCSGFGPGDCRLTTRYDERYFPQAFFGTLHEAGHGLYEQGLRREAFGSPAGQPVSLGIHESQSRMWENFVGRSLPFWSCFFPRAQAMFPEALADVREEDFYAAINVVEPSFIRVEADEVTYNLHIMLRFELERPLIAGELAVPDVPHVWSELCTQYLGLTPPDDAQGCLQDVHWSAGLIGYFPTYALGNMYAAQFFRKAAADLGDLPGQFARGEFQSLREWLRGNIHQRGQQYRAGRLLDVVTGEALSHEPLVHHLRQKFGPLYGLN
jgi:carboxypeptidase Taq